MIILYIIAAFLIFILLLFSLLLLLPLRMYVNATYQNKNPKAEISAFWIKYLLGTRIFLDNMNKMQIRLWILGIPLPIKVPLKKDVKKAAVNDKIKRPRFAQTQDTAKKKKHSIEKLIDKILQIIRENGDLWDTYSVYIRKIFVRYITYYSLRLQANIGLRDPALTGEAAATYYIIKTYRFAENVNITWDFRQPAFEADLQTKISMRLYGIFLTLLQLYWKYRRIKSYESKRNAFHPA